MIQLQFKKKLQFLINILIVKRCLLSFIFLVKVLIDVVGLEFIDKKQIIGV